MRVVIMAVSRFAQLCWRVVRIMLCCGGCVENAGAENVGAGSVGAENFMLLMLVKRWRDAEGMDTPR